MLLSIGYPQHTSFNYVRLTHEHILPIFNVVKHKFEVVLILGPDFNPEGLTL